MAGESFATALKGILRNKDGKALYMETSADKVLLSASQSASDKFGLYDQFQENIYDSAAGKLKMSVMPEILQHNKGTFTNEAAVIAGVTNPVAGDYCINTETDTVWIYDGEGSKWLDSDRKGQVTSVNGKTGEVVLGIAEIESLQDELDARVKTADIVNSVAEADAKDVADKPLSAGQGYLLDVKASELDFAVIEHGGTVPANLRSTGMYIELDA